MTPIPLDDVLQFRAEHQDAHRAYMRDLRGFMAELAEIDNSNEREALLLERRQEIAGAAREIQRSTKQALGKGLRSWSLGIAGGVWSVATGDPIGLALTAAGVVSAIVPSVPRKGQRVFLSVRGQSDIRNVDHFDRIPVSSPISQSVRRPRYTGVWQARALQRRFDIYVQPGAKPRLLDPVRGELVHRNDVAGLDALHTRKRERCAYSRP